MTKPRIFEHTLTVLGIPAVRFSCSCAFTSGTYVAAHAELGRAEMREHLADEHGAQLDVGRCERCGQPTEHFRAVTQLGALYLCEAHSPAMSDLDTEVPAP